jgi:hypothetical protein
MPSAYCRRTAARAPVHFRVTGQTQAPRMATPTSRTDVVQRRGVPMRAVSRGAAESMRVRRRKTCKPSGVAVALRLTKATGRFFGGGGGASKKPCSRRKPRLPMKSASSGSGKSGSHSGPRTSTRCALGSPQTTPKWFPASLAGTRAHVMVLFTLPG